MAPITPTPRERSSPVAHAACPCGLGRPQDCSRHRPYRGWMPEWRRRAAEGIGVAKDMTGAAR